MGRSTLNGLASGILDEIGGRGSESISKKE
jgi:hypothetical protein